ncbi:MAG: indole-3-glycerol phosphate synthase TrpC [Christensenellaceae bacterium]|jgi:indole-3-glycerol phosphate synthase|nr:indole-3-glycerol phosphate synthase TrpC [Christensenellaceae bacterium]
MILDQIVEKKIGKLNIAKQIKPIKDLKREALLLTTDYQFEFERAMKISNEISFICELKKASPSKGIIVKNFDHKLLAIEYEKASADGLSVLTENDYFLGQDLYLKDAKGLVSIPVLRKDFVIDEYQIYETKILNADALLLIVSLLDFKRLRDYIKICDDLGLSALVETRDEREIDIALEAGSRMIGVNNRDLRTFSVDNKKALRLKKHVPGDRIFVVESGISNRDEVKMYENVGANAILIGEHMILASDKKKYLAQLRGRECQTK